MTNGIMKQVLTSFEHVKPHFILNFHVFFSCSVELPTQYIHAFYISKNTLMFCSYWKIGKRSVTSDTFFWTFLQNKKFCHVLWIFHVFTLFRKVGFETKISGTLLKLQSGPSMMSWVDPHPFNRVDPHPSLTVQNVCSKIAKSAFNVQFIPQRHFSNVLCMLLCPNSPLTPFNGISKEDNQI